MIVHVPCKQGCILQKRFLFFTFPSTSLTRFCGAAVVLECLSEPSSTAVSGSLGRAHSIVVFALHLFDWMSFTFAGACDPAGEPPGQQSATPILGDRSDTPAGLERGYGRPLQSPVLGLWGHAVPVSANPLYGAGRGQRNGTRGVAGRSFPWAEIGSCCEEGRLVDTCN